MPRHPDIRIKAIREKEPQNGYKFKRYYVHELEDTMAANSASGSHPLTQPNHPEGS
jgi:hypothetical protein